jgi:hypothetical protein
MSQGGIYSKADFDVSVKIANEGPNPIDQFSIEIHLPIELLARPHTYIAEDGYAIIREDYNTRLFKGQSKTSQSYKTTITPSIITKVFGKPIIVKVYSDSDLEEKTFKLADSFHLRNNNGMAPLPLSVELFTGFY